MTVEPRSQGRACRSVNPSAVAGPAFGSDFSDAAQTREVEHHIDGRRRKGEQAVHLGDGSGQHVDLEWSAAREVFSVDICCSRATGRLWQGDAERAGNGFCLPHHAPDARANRKPVGNRPGVTRSARPPDFSIGR
jgi:hypothetical protein